MRLAKGIEALILNMRVCLSVGIYVYVCGQYFSNGSTTQLHTCMMRPATVRLHTEFSVGLCYWRIFVILTCNLK